MIYRALYLFLVVMIAPVAVRASFFASDGCSQLFSETGPDTVTSRPRAEKPALTRDQIQTAKSRLETLVSDFSGESTAEDWARFLVDAEAHSGHLLSFLANLPSGELTGARSLARLILESATEEDHAAIEAGIRAVLERGKESRSGPAVMARERTEQTEFEKQMARATRVGSHFFDTSLAFWLLVASANSTQSQSISLNPLTLETPIELGDEPAPTVPSGARFINQTDFLARWAGTELEFYFQGRFVGGYELDSPIVDFFVKPTSDGLGEIWLQTENGFYFLRAPLSMKNGSTPPLEGHPSPQDVLHSRIATIAERPLHFVTFVENGAPITRISEIGSETPLVQLPGVLKAAGAISTNQEEEGRAVVTSGVASQLVQIRMDGNKSVVRRVDLPIHADRAFLDQSAKLLITMDEELHRLDAFGLRSARAPESKATWPAFDLGSSAPDAVAIDTADRDRFAAITRTTAGGTEISFFDVSEQRKMPSLKRAGHGERFDGIVKLSFRFNQIVVRVETDTPNGKRYRLRAYQIREW